MRIGFRPLVVDEVPVRIGNATDLGEITLEPEAVELGEILVRASPRSIDPASTTIGADVAAATYDALPVGRDYRSVVDFLQHANTSYYPGDPVNIGGATGLENAYFIDGLDVTGPHLASAGPSSLPVASFGLPYNFVRAVEVKEGGYDARYGRAIGGTISAVTYSGGTRFGGEAFGFFTNDALSGRRRIGLSDVPSTEFTDYDVGARTDGPILRDRLWFAAAYEEQIETADLAIPGAGAFADRLRRPVFAGKLSWRAAASTNVQLLLFGDRSTHHEVSAASFSALGGFTTVANLDPYLLFLQAGHMSAALRLTRQLASRGVLEVSVGRTTSFTRQGAETTRGGSEPLYLDYVTSTISGGVIQRESASDARTSAALHSTLELGAHTVDVGVDYEDNRFSDAMRSGFILRFDTAAWIQDSVVTRGTVHDRVPTLYAEDSWRLGSRFTLNAGLRWSAEYLVGPGGVAQSFPAEWQPRLGAVLQLGRLGSQRIFGSWGISYQQQPLDFAFLFYVPRAEFVSYSSSDPRLPSTRPDSARTFATDPSQFPNVPGLQVEHHREMTLGYQRLVGRNLKVTVRAVRRDLLSAFGFGLNPGGSAFFVIGVPGQGGLSFLPKFRRTYGALELSAEWAGPRGFETRFSYVLSRTYGNYTGLYASDYGAPSPGGLGGLQLAVQGKNSTGLLPNDRAHVLKLIGQYALGFGLKTGMFFTWQSGTPLNEFGTGAATYGRRTFLVPRGSAGRTPAVWDLNVRFAYPLRIATDAGARVMIDWLHVGSPRRPVLLEQLRYTSEDANGNPTNPNPTYGDVLRYQPATQVRLGMELTF